MDTGSNKRPVSFIGFGEAGQAFASGMMEGDAVAAHAFDIKTQTEARDGKLADYAKRGATGHEALADALAASDLVFSLVTADQAHTAAQQAAAAGIKGRLFLDCNSCAPQTKAKSAEVIEAAGGLYVDVAVMMPVYPDRHRAPILLSGPHATAALKAMQALDMDVTEAAGPVGRASGIKLCRSIIIKGMEALNAEMILTARTLGVEDAVWGALAPPAPGVDSETATAMALERMMVHGVRRAAEMDEAAVMVNALGLPSGMTQAMVDWQAKLGALALDPGPDDARARADAILGALRKT